MARDANKKLSLQRSERPEAHTQQKLAQVSPSPEPYLFPTLSLCPHYRNAWNKL